MVKIQAGKSVNAFLNDINSNFDEITQTHTDELPKKQDKIFIATNNDTVGDNIEIINGVPSGGKNGDILIIYEK